MVCGTSTCAMELFCGVGIRYRRLVAYAVLGAVCFFRGDPVLGALGERGFVFSKWLSFPDLKCIPQLRTVVIPFLQNLHNIDSAKRAFITRSLTEAKKNYKTISVVCSTDAQTPIAAWSSGRRTIILNANYHRSNPNDLLESFLFEMSNAANPFFIRAQGRSTSELAKGNLHGGAMLIEAAESQTFHRVVDIASELKKYKDAFIIRDQKILSSLKPFYKGQSIDSIFLILKAEMERQFASIMRRSQIALNKLLEHTYRTGHTQHYLTNLQTSPHFQEGGALKDIDVEKVYSDADDQSRMFNRQIELRKNLVRGILVSPSPPKLQPMAESAHVPPHAPTVSKYDLKSGWESLKRFALTPSHPGSTALEATVEAGANAAPQARFMTFLQNTRAFLEKASFLLSRYTYPNDVDSIPQRDLLLLSYIKRNLSTFSEIIDLSRQKRPIPQIGSEIATLWHKTDLSSWSLTPNLPSVIKAQRRRLPPSVDPEELRLFYRDTFDGIRTKVRTFLDTAERNPTVRDKVIRFFSSLSFDTYSPVTPSERNPTHVQSSLETSVNIPALFMRLLQEADFPLFQKFSKLVEKDLKTSERSSRSSRQTLSFLRTLFFVAFSSSVAWISPEQRGWGNVTLKEKGPLFDSVISVVQFLADNPQHLSTLDTVPEQLSSKEEINAAKRVKGLLPDNSSPEETLNYIIDAMRNAQKEPL